jgi:hypothetical protein
MPVAFENAGLAQPAENLLKEGFVSGHDFSQAEELHEAAARFTP